MYNWLENDLMNVTQDWIVAFWHHPPYTKGSHDSDTEGRLIDMRQNFLPLLESYGVDLVLGGHSHSYERTFLMKGHYGNSGSLNPSTMILDNGDGNLTGDGAYQKTVTGPAAGDGAVYVVAGSSGQISGVSQHPAMYTWQNQLGSVLLEVEGGQMTVQFIDNNGNSDDEFTIEKDLDNLPPIANNDSGVTFESVPVVVDVLDNDTDPSGSLDPTSVQVTSGPANGFVSVNPANGEITYTSNPGFSGIETFDYEVCDNGVPAPVLCATATVSIDVQINYAPVANDDAATTNESTATFSW